MAMIDPKQMPPGHFQGTPNSGKEPVKSVMSLAFDSAKKDRLKKDLIEVLEEEAEEKGIEEVTVIEEVKLKPHRPPFSTDDDSIRLDAWYGAYTKMGQVCWLADEFFETKVGEISETQIHYEREANNCTKIREFKPASHTRLKPCDDYFQKDPLEGWKGRRVPTVEQLVAQEELPSRVFGRLERKLRGQTPVSMAKAANDEEGVVAGLVDGFKSEPIVGRTEAKCAKHWKPASANGREDLSDPRNVSLMHDEIVQYRCWLMMNTYKPFLVDRPDKGLKWFFRFTGVPRRDSYLALQTEHYEQMYKSDNNRRAINQYHKPLIKFRPKNTRYASDYKYDVVWRRDDEKRYQAWQYNMVVHNEQLLNDKVVRKVRSAADRKLMIYTAFCRKYKAGNITLERLHVAWQSIYGKKIKINKSTAVTTRGSITEIYNNCFDDERKRVGRAYKKRSSELLYAYGPPKPDNLETTPKFQDDLPEYQDVVEAKIADTITGRIHSEIRIREMIREEMRHYTRAMINEFYMVNGDILSEVREHLEEATAEIMKKCNRVSQSPIPRVKPPAGYTLNECSVYQPDYYTLTA